MTITMQHQGKAEAEDAAQGEPVQAEAGNGPLPDVVGLPPPPAVPTIVAGGDEKGAPDHQLPVPDGGPPLFLIKGQG